MEKVTTELEALALCKEHTCEIAFKKMSTQPPKEYVTVTLNAWTTTIGADLVEATNRMVDVYHTAPVNYDKLPWWNESLSFFK